MSSRAASDEIREHERGKVARRGHEAERRHTLRPAGDPWPVRDVDLTDEQVAPAHDDEDLGLEERAAAPDLHRP